MEMKQEKHLAAGEVSSFPLGRGENTILSVSGDPDEWGSLTDQGGCDVEAAVAEEGCSLGQQAAQERKIHGAGAAIAGDDATDAEVSAGGFHGELL